MKRSWGYGPGQGQPPRPPSPHHHMGGMDQEMHAFRARFPMDDRAFKYILESPPEVRRHVLDSFTPPRIDDADFSAPIVGYAKMLRSRFAGGGAPSPGPCHGGGGYGPGFGGGRGPVGPGHGGLGGHGYMNHGGGGPGMGGYHGSHMGSGGRGGMTGLQDLRNFCARYPMDERAVDYLRESPPEVIDQVLREFKPKREGDGDYSAPVVAYTKKCRNMAMGSFHPPPPSGGGSYGMHGAQNYGPTPPWKRPRMM